MISVPVIVRTQVGRDGRKSCPFLCREIMKRPITIMNTEIVTGAITGPIQGKGIKNRISKSNTDDGHAIATLSQT